MNFKDRLTSQRRLPRNEEILMGRASLLLSKDRDLIEAVFVRGQSLRAIARMTGTSAKSVRCRLERLCRIIVSREFLVTARAMPYMSQSDATLARLSFCAHVPQRALAKRLGISLSALRRRLDRVKAQVETLARLRSLRRRGPRRQADQGELNLAASATSLLEGMEHAHVS